VADPRLPVLHLLSGLEIGGKEKVALQLARHARAEGHDHRLLLFDTPFRSSELDFTPGEVPCDFTPRRPGLDLSLPRRILATARRHKLGAIHAHNDSAIVYGALAALLSGRKVGLIGTFHTWPSHPTPRARMMTRLLARAATSITAVSDELRARLKAEKWLDHCVTVPNGVDLEEYRPAGSDGGWRQRLDLTEPDVLVAQIGRLDPIKRADDLITAAQLLHEPCAHIRFALAGRGPHRASLDRQIGALRTFRILDHVEDMPAFLRSVDISVLCSDHEAHPLVLLEAMAAGRAIIATAVGGVPSLLRGPGEQPCGVLVPPRAPDILAAEIRALAEDPARRAELGARARHRVQDFSFAKCWSAYRRLYGAAISGPAPAL
jgi:L-malate glycosyltransferase